MFVLMGEAFGVNSPWIKSPWGLGSRGAQLADAPSGAKALANAEPRTAKVYFQ